MKFKVKDLIDTLISHNEMISLWYENPEDNNQYYLQHKSEGHMIPKNLLNQEVIKIFSCVPGSDSINILIKINQEEE